MEIKEAVALGVEAENFLNSSLGRTMIARANIEVEAAKNALVDVDPGDVSRIIELQNIVVRFRCFESWINEVIVAGEVAYDEYKQGEE